MPVQIGQPAEHGFDQPLGLLSDCHRRIERFLGAMLVVSRAERGRPLGASARSALEQARTYFRTAAPRHTVDEEQGLFPLLRAAPGGEGAELLAAVDGLESDHRTAEAGHARVDALVSRWLEAQVLPEDEAQELVETLEALQRLYARHILLEDRELFPAASRILPAHQLEQLGRQMAERRGVGYRGPVARFLGADHERLEALLHAATAGAEGVRFEPFGAFRAGLLRHIAMEEKRLIPAATEARHGRGPPLAARLRVDHGALAALLVPTPTREIVGELRSILTPHNRREEEPGGLYDECDRALGAERALRLVEELRAYPPVRLKPYNDVPAVQAHVRAWIERAREAWTEQGEPESRRDVESPSGRPASALATDRRTGEGPHRDPWPSTDGGRPG